MGLFRQETDQDERLDKRDDKENSVKVAQQNFEYLMELMKKLSELWEQRKEMKLGLEMNKNQFSEDFEEFLNALAVMNVLGGEICDNFINIYPR